MRCLSVKEIRKGEEGAPDDDMLGMGMGMGAGAAGPGPKHARSVSAYAGVAYGKHSSDDYRCVHGGQCWVPGCMCSGEGGRGSRGPARMVCSSAVLPSSPPAHPV